MVGKILYWPLNQTYFIYFSLFIFRFKISMRENKDFIIRLIIKLLEAIIDSYQNSNDSDSECPDLLTDLSDTDSD